jgi:ech hydrogenase subunit D
MEKMQSFFEIGTDTLKNMVWELKESGYRLVQMSCTAGDGYEILYSFDKDYTLVNLRVRLGSGGTAVPSISGIFWNAFAYENEIHDLFGIQVNDMVLDFKGKFYRLKTKTPWASGNGRKEGDDS